MHSLLISDNNKWDDDDGDEDDDDEDDEDVDDDDDSAVGFWEYEAATELVFYISIIPKLPKIAAFC